MNVFKYIVFLSIAAAATLNEVPDHITLVYIFFAIYLPTHQSYAPARGLLLTVYDFPCFLTLLLTLAMLALSPFLLLLLSLSSFLFLLLSLSIVVCMCIPLGTEYTDHIFISLLAICIYSLVNCYFSHWLIQSLDALKA